MRLPIALALLLPSLCACGGAELEDARHPTGSQTIAASSDYSALYVANTQEDSVTRLPVGGEPISLSLEGEPTRIARAGDQVFVTLRAKRQVAVLHDDGARLTETARIRVGHEPFGVVANEEGTRVYVASSLSNTIQEIDTSSLEVLRELEVSDEPRWLALHPGGTLYVAAAWRGSLFSIDLETGAIERTQLPQIPMLNVADRFGDGFMSARITGDPTVTPDGDHLLIPTIYADNLTPIVEPAEGEERGPSSGADGPSTGYTDQRRFNPSVTVVSIDGERPKTEEGTIVPMRSFTFSGDVIGYPASVTVSPDGNMALAAIEGAGAIIAFTLDGSDGDRGEIAEAGSGVPFATEVFDGRGNLAFDVVGGVRGVAFTGEQSAAAYGFLDRTVAQFEVDPDLWRDTGDPFRPVEGIRKTVVAESNLAYQVELGRKLFYSTRDGRMSVPSSGLSCATCHFDGRTDGLTWNFDRGPRQTPSLAGKVSLTAPVRWEGDRETVAIDAMRTSQGLMGGQGLSERETLAIEAFVDFTRDVDSPLKGEEDPRVARGAEIFNRPEVGCATCHSGERYTDNQRHSMFELSEVKTRSLVGIAGSPPYFHDGSAATLRDVLIRAESGAMGNTSTLSDAEIADLEAFLESL